MLLLINEEDKLALRSLSQGNNKGSQSRNGQEQHKTAILGRSGWQEAMTSDKYRLLQLLQATSRTNFRSQTSQNRIAKLVLMYNANIAHFVCPFYVSVRWF